MSYSIKVNTGSGLQLMNNASFDGVTLLRYRDEDSIRVRDKLDGGVTFWGGDYAKLKGELDAGKIQVDCSVSIENDVIYSGKLQLRGEWHEWSDKCILEVEIDDQYTEILRNIDIEFDYDYPRYSELLKMQTHVSVRNAFQMRAIHITGDNTPHETSTWLYCNEEYSTSLIKDFDHTQEYTPTDYVLPASNEAYMSDPDNVAVQFCRDGNGFWACKKLNVGANRPVIGNSNEHWQKVGSKFGVSSAFKMGQNYSGYEFPGAIYSDENKEWQKSGCAPFFGSFEFYASKLFNYLADLLNRADPGISIDFNTFMPYIHLNYPQYSNLAVYQNDFRIGENFTVPPSVYKLSDVIGIYESMFNVQWRIESGYFVFRHDSESPSLPTDYQAQPYQFIDRIFAKDWSSEIFTSDLKEKIYRETFTIGSSENKYFETQRLDYDNNYFDKYEYTNTIFEIDITHVSKDVNDQTRKCIIVYDDSNDVIAENEFMKMSSLVTLFHKDGRPFGEAILNGTLFDNPQPISLTLLWIWNSEIQIPYNRQDLLDFDYLIVTSYGNLKVSDLSVNLQAASSIIKASKQ